MVDEPESGKKARRMAADREAAIGKMRIDIELARGEFEARLSQLRAEMEAARDEFRRAVQRIAALDTRRTPGTFRGDWPEIMTGRRRPRPPRPWRGLDGGDPVPVEPKPKPKPLLDGAEAPIE